MMMKIFGAALIISGGYFFGKIHGFRRKKRLNAIKEIRMAYEGFERALSEYRCSAVEFFGNRGSPWDESCGNSPMDGLSAEDYEKLSDLMNDLKTASFRDALKKVRDYLAELSALIEILEEEVKTSGKALPLVTATLGILVAVFLI